MHLLSELLTIHRFEQLIQTFELKHSLQLSIYS